MMDATAAAEILARALRDDRLIALVGSGTSAQSTDGKGRTYDGLPTPSEFVGLAAAQIRYVDSTHTFTQACDLIQNHEGRRGLEEVLLRYYGVPEAFGIPPAHRLLSWLPFSHYITSNFDQFIERSLEAVNRRPYVMIDNEDLIRFKRGQTAVIKYHGCVSRPGSMVATTADYDHLDRQRSLIRQLVTVSLASKTLLVVGHGLSDSDLARLLDELLRSLNDYAPSIVVLRESGHNGRLPGVKASVEVVAEDLTVFLNRLLHEFRNLQQAEAVPFFEEGWLSSSFFAQLRQAAVLPSETQVIDAFLDQLREELGARDEVESVAADARSAVASALRERPNYGALERVWRAVDDRVAGVTDPAEAEGIVEQFIRDRTRHISLFEALGPKVIKQSQRIVVFSQSQRVLQLLRGAPINTQRTCHIFVAECRPKSPNPYQDAAAISKELSETSYKVTVCPDVVAVNLLSTGQVDQVLMGTHAIYVDDDTDPESSAHGFVNTCGSLALAIGAQRFGVPINVVGEMLKVEVISRDIAADHLHAHQEEDLLQNAMGIHNLRTRRADVGHLNVGYDLVPISENVTMWIPDSPHFHG